MHCSNQVHRLISLPLFILSYSLGYCTSLKAFEVSGKVVIEREHYQDDGEHYQHTIDDAHSLFVRSDAKYTMGDLAFKAGFILRENQRDKSRDMFLPQDIYLSAFFGRDSTWKILLGYKLFNWSVLEVFHPTSGVNTPNYGSPPENWEKTGEPVLELEKSFDFGSINLYYFPRFEKAVFPDSNSRMALLKDGSKITIDNSSIKIVDGKLERGNKIPQYGAKINWSAEGMDLSAYFLRHIDRRIPLFGTHEYKFLGRPPYRIAIPENFKTFTFHPVPYYVMANEAGLTLEAVYRDFILKLEGAHLKYDSHKEILTGQKVASTGYGLRKKEDYTHLAAGLEKTFSLLGGQDTTFICEYSEIFGVPEELRLYAETFQKDIFFGVKHEFNDSMSKSFKLGVVTDLEGGERGEKLYYASYTQRIGSNWSLEVGGREYDAPPPTEEEEEKISTSGLETYHEANSYFINFSLHF